MSEMASFTRITHTALSAVWQRRKLWWFAVPAAMLIRIGSVLTADIQRTLPETTDFSLWFAALADSHSLRYLGFSLAIVLGQALLRGPFIHSLERGLREQETPSADNSRRRLFRAAIIALSFEAMYWLLLLLIAGLVVIPGFLAWHFNPSALPAILELGVLVLMALGVYLYFIKEFSLFYALLGKLQFSSAVDLGFRLFRRQAFYTALFFSYASLLAFFFTLFFSALADSLFKTDPNPIIELFTALPFGFYFLFDQALRLMFFRTIALTPKKPIADAVALKPSESPSSVTPS